MKISVIVSTYNSEKWLEKVIIGMNQQTFTEFELVIADDGSDEKTRNLIERWRPLVRFNMQHIWHEDDGFQKTKILNKAILASKTDYLIFTDGDCIPRKDFVATHLKYRRKNYFLSGGYFKMSLETSEKVTEKDIIAQNCFQSKWLQENGTRWTIKFLKLSTSAFLSRFLNTITPTNPSWNGHNSSGWKADLMAVNGFNNEMKYGGEDRELGERLFHLGVKSKQIRYSAVCVHLEHARGYMSDEVWEKNNQIRATTLKNKVIKTSTGISEL
ncbi:glycosyltransferase family 2 protein [Flavobacterium sp.]|uniref:glycosyltransferase family 2 protein n=1 Tax=Flavobacterium sp. TaxID=239 RepID=UPI0037BF5CBA